MRLHAREKIRPKNSGRTKSPVAVATRCISTATLTLVLPATALAVALAILAIALVGAITGAISYAWWGLVDAVRWRRERKRREGHAPEFCLAGIPEADKAQFTAQLLSLGAEMAWTARQADRASRGEME